MCVSCRAESDSGKQRIESGIDSPILMLVLALVSAPVNRDRAHIRRDCNHLTAGIPPTRTSAPSRRGMRPRISVRARGGAITPAGTRSRALGRGSRHLCMALAPQPVRPPHQFDSRSGRETKVSGSPRTQRLGTRGWGRPNWDCCLASKRVLVPSLGVVISIRSCS
ncbi:hypothetical protein VTG60DRAFT_2867 [Thermothelomyces hinnuleus]